jgi:hypothetical protein
MRSPADVDAFETKQDAQPKQLPRMRSSADTDAYEAKLAWQQKRVTGMQSPADVEKYETQHDREHRERAHVNNPGQGDFDVKMEHESVWTQQPRRDIDAESIEGTGKGRKGKKA